MSPTPFVARTARFGLAGAAAAAALAAYGRWEAHQFTLREATMAILPSGADPLRVLHLTDIHMTPTQPDKVDWLRGLASLEPDLVINTGDNLGHPESVPIVVDALGELLKRPGVFVFGSNDYFAPTAKNPLKYLLPDDGKRRTGGPRNPWPNLHHAFVDAGWLDLTNQEKRLQLRDMRFWFAGVDDPHLKYDDLEAVEGPPPAEVDVALAVAHAPYLRVLDQFAADGYAAIIAGHTHGGQICLPYYGALATNCDLEKDRAKGLHRHPADSRPGDPGSSWLHVSAGVGAAPKVPLRVACRPEATLLHLTAADSI